MGDNYFNRFYGYLSWVKGRILTLQKSYILGQIYVLSNGKAKGAFLVLIAICLAAVANRIARNEAFRELEKNHFPSPLIWDYALTARGFHKVTENLMQRVYRSLPLTISSEGTVWSSKDLQWFAVYDRNINQQNPVTIYCRSCKNHSKEIQTLVYWEPHGSGWAALETISISLDRDLSNITTNSKSSINSVLARDPREIRY
ncbi:MAG: hypothetical protein AABZ06_07280 [Bdellovibrionota bacterium]